MYGLTRMEGSTMAKPRRSSLFDNNLFDIDEMFEDAFSPLRDILSSKVLISSGVDLPHATRSTSETTDTGAKITIDLPGVAMEDASVYVVNDSLCIQGKRGEKTYLTNFNISGYDASTIKASLADGVMTVTLETKPDPKSVRREIKIETKK